MSARALRLLVVVATIAFPTTALAEDETAPAPPKTSAETVHFAPTASWLAGQWMGVPVTRWAGGMDIMIDPKKAPVAFDVTALYASGSTENGLEAKRIEIGSAVSSKPGLFRIAGGAHLSYAWLNRKTMNESIVGIGIGAHALVECAVPLGEAVALTIGLRGSADLYDGGYGYEGGPFAGLRF